MELFCSWAVVMLLTVIIVLSYFQRRKKAIGQGIEGEPAETGFLNGCTVIDWGLLIAAICFLVGAIFGTLNALS